VRAPGLRHRTVDQELLAPNDSVTDAEVIGNTRSPAGRLELVLRSRFFCVILSQGHDISGDIGELVVGKQRVRHAPRSAAARRSCVAMMRP
jgi:hypothetical protein